MQHTTTNALVLRAVDYKESDKILTLLTPELGKISASARRCRKHNSPLAASCQLLCWSEMVLYDNRGKWTVQEATSLRQFRGMRSDLEKFALACYLAQVTEVLAVEGMPCPDLLSLTLNSLHALDKLNRPVPLIKGAFELKAMGLSGYEPMLDFCGVCGAEELEEPQFYLREGVLHCKTCRKGVGEGISMPLDGNVRKAMHHVLWGDPKRLFSFQLGEESLKRFSDLAEAYLHTQLERGFHTLDFYKQVCAPVSRIQL